MNTTKEFALTYLGSKFGEAGSCSDTGAAFCHESIKATNDGFIPYAVHLEYDDNNVAPLMIWINDDLPSELLYQVYGYAAMNSIPIINLK